MNRNVVLALIGALVTTATVAPASAQRYVMRQPIKQLKSTAADSTPTGTKMANGRTITCPSAGTQGLFYYGGSQLGGSTFQNTPAAALKQCEADYNAAIGSYTGSLAGYQFACNVAGVSNGSGGLKYQGQAMAYGPGQNPQIYDDRTSKAYGVYSGDLCTLQ